MNTSDLKYDRHELSGSMADLGVFLPLAIALITLNGMSATPVFLTAGLAYIFAGFYYRIPMPVQPLKAASVIAIAMSASPAVIAATALSMSAVLLIGRHLNLKRAMEWLFPRAIVRGIQLTIGLVLIKKGALLLFGESLFLSGENLMFKIFITSPIFAMFLGLFSLLLILVFRGSKKFPAGLAVMGFGILIGAIAAGPDGLSQITIGWDFAKLSLPALADFYIAIPALLLPQLPLTFGNSIIATEETSRQYFGEGAKRVTIPALMTSIGIMNIFSGIIGGLPMCHGSGGLTAHYRFGSRTGGSSVIIGAIFIIVALLFGKSATAIFGLIPLPILGVMLLYIGFMHTFLIKDIVCSPWELALAVLIAGITLSGAGLAIAFLIAIVIYMIAHLVGRKSKLG